MALTGPGVRVVLVGNSRHVHGSTLPDVPAVASTVRDLAHALVARCGVDPANLCVLLDPVDPMELGNVLTEAAVQAEDVLLFYYLGHGLVSASKQLHLATQATDGRSQVLALNSLPYSAVLDALAYCRARIVVVLDCCFAGRAYGSLGGAPDDAMAAAHMGGSYLLAAAARDEAALAPPGERYTAFSGELLRLLRDGDPTGPPSLTLDHTYRYLERALRDKGLPRPRRQAAGAADDLVLAPNPGYQPPAPRARPTPAPVDGDGAAEDASPYRGLATYGFDDARYFFGREHLTHEVVRRLAERLPDAGPLVVIGPSGSGKSSLLLAGLLPALREGRLPIPASHTWPVMVFTPGAEPLLELAGRVAPRADAAQSPTRDDLISNPSWLVEATRELLESRTEGRDISGGRLVLIVDQFEQLFTACPDPVEHQAVIQALSRASGPGSDGFEAPALVVIGVRADFYGHCAAHPELVPALQSGQVVVGPMTTDELVQAIEEPAAAAGLALEEGLVDVVLGDLRASGTAGSEHGSLPLLSHALLATWQHREGRHLTIAGYHATGGISQAVARTAEDTYASLAPADQRAAQRALLCLVRVGDATEDTRRRVTRADLNPSDPAADATAVGRVVDAFACARLLTLDEDTVQIAHEALLRAWPRLRGWIDTDRSGLLVGQQLADAAAAWKREHRDPAALCRGTRLSAAREWVEAGHQHELTALTREFLDTSVRRERRRIRSLYQIIAALAVLAVIAASAGVIAFRLRDDAIHQRALAISRLVAVEADRVLNNDVSLAMQLSLAAYRIAPTTEARSSLLNSSAAPAATRMLGSAGVLHSVALSPDQRTLAAGSADKSLRLWDVTDARRPAALGPPLRGPTDRVTSVAFSPDGRTLAAGSADKSVHLWNVTDPRLPASRGPSLTGPTDVVNSVAISPDGRTLAAGSSDKSVHLWNVTDPQQPVSLGPPVTGPAGGVNSVAFSPDGHTLAAGSFDRTVRLWNVENPGRPIPAGGPLTGPALAVFSVVFSPDGQTLAAGSADKNIWLWNISNPKQPASLGPPLSGSTSWVNSVVFSPDGSTVAAGSADDAVRLWDLATRRVLDTLPHPGPVTTVTFGRDSHTVVTGAADGAARVWKLPGPVLTGPTDSVFTTVFTPDGRTLAVVSGDGTARLWNVADPRHPMPLGAPITSPTRLSSFVGSAAFSPDGRTLAIGTVDGTVQLWDVADPRQPVLSGGPLTGLTRFAESLAVSPDGRTLAAGSADGTVQLWNVANPRQPTTLAALTEPDHNVYSVAFSPDGRTLAAGSADKAVRLWDVTDPTRPIPLGAPLTGPTSYVYHVAFSPDSRTLAVGSADSTLRLWDVTIPKRPTPLGTPLTGPKGYVFSVAFSPNGQTVATGNTDNTVWLWDMANPRQPRTLATLTGPTDAVLSVAFNRDGRTLAAGGHDKTVRLWNTDPDAVADHICSIAGDPITREEWSQYVPDLPYNPPC